MVGKTIREKGSLRAVVYGLCAWVAAAIVLLTAAAFILSKTSVSSGSIGYISSIISFCAGLAAGLYAARRSGKEGIWNGLLTRLFLTILLLGLGFLIGEKEMSSSGVLSVVTFTISGCVIGGLLGTSRRKGARKRRSAARPKARSKS